MARRSLAELDKLTNPERQSLSAHRGGEAANDNPRNQFGPAAFISRRLAYYIAFGILFGIIYQGPRQFLGYLINDAE